MATREWLKDVVDIHVHAYPEIGLRVRNAAFDDEWLAEAQAAGMRAVCLKSHYWPTADKAFTLGRMFPGTNVFGSLVLNSTVGGLNPLAVKVAIACGARMVWFPTFSAANDVERKGYSGRVAATHGPLPPTSISVLQGDGKLCPEALEILELIAEADIAVATGHLSLAESKVLTRAARERGVKRIVLTHALSAMVGASVEDQVALADAGAFIEHSFVACMPMHQQLSPRTIAGAIRAVGAERCVISTDAVFSWNPSPPTMMTMFMESLAELGMSEREIHLMARSNPAYIMGL
ncbi:MAG TPA: DUF6282 family protein [Symbiobacteriaceae bacterium]|nr:DUF6282 family protein [Symbiobacteriaceae bacterium]